MAKELKTSEAQRRANERWKEKNKEKQRIYIMRSTTRRFLSEFATDEDIAEVLEIINNRG